MEVALMALGVGLIIASFEIHFRYLDTAKNYYKKQLDAISIELEEFLKKKKPSEKDQVQLSQFFKGLNKILTNFSIERDRANFPHHLLYGFLGLGIYAILISFLYDQILFYINNPFITSSDANGLLLVIVVFAILPGIFVFRGLVSLRKITRIV